MPRLRWTSTSTCSHCGKTFHGHPNQRKNNKRLHILAKHSEQSGEKEQITLIVKSAIEEKKEETVAVSPPNNEFRLNLAIGGKIVALKQAMAVDTLVKDVIGYVKSQEMVDDKAEIALFCKREKMDPNNNLGDYNVKSHINLVTVVVKPNPTDIVNGPKIVYKKTDIAPTKVEIAIKNAIETKKTVEKSEAYKAVKQEMEKSIDDVSNVRQKTHSSFVSADVLVSAQYKKEKKAAEQLTASVLSQDCSGDLSDKNTLLHILSGASKENGKECLFFDSSKGTVDSSGSTSNALLNVGTQQDAGCVLKLDGLKGLGGVNEDHEDTKTEEKSDVSLKERVVELRSFISMNKTHPILEDVRSRLAAVHRTDVANITINDVYYGSCAFEYTVENTPHLKAQFDNGSAAFKEKFESFKEMKIHPALFENRFDIADFDDRGHKSFVSLNATFQVGPTGKQKMYTQPHGWTGYGLKVLDGRYGGDHTWLHPFQNQNNWYRAFHGTNIAVGKNIIDGAFRAGGGQAYRSSISPIDGLPIGDGIYCSPLPTSAQGYSRTVDINTHRGRKRFYFMFQIGVDPNRTHVSQRSDYWIVRSADAATAIRPYRILLKEV